MKRQSLILDQAISFTSAEILQLNNAIEEFTDGPEGSEIYNSLRPSQLIKFIVFILTRPSYQRTTSMINFMIRSTIDNKFFRDLRGEFLGLEMHERCCRRMHYLYYPINAYIFRQGEKGNLFYIILSGRVAVTKTIEAEGFFSEQELVQLTDGAAFGELALLKEQPRSASVKTLQNCHLGVLSKEDFNVIIKNMLNKKNQIYYEEFAAISLFKPLQFRHIKTLYDRVKLKKVGINHVVYKEGDQISGVYFIKRGEFKVTKSVKMSTIDLNEYFYGNLEQMIDFYAKEPALEARSTLEEAIEKQIQKKKFGNTYYQNKDKTITIKTLGDEQMFGESELFMRQRERQETVMSTLEENEIYFITRADFLESLLFHKELNQLFKNLAQQKNSYLLQQVSNYQRNFNDLTQKKQELSQNLHLNFLQIDNTLDNNYYSNPQPSNSQASQARRSTAKQRQNNLSRSTLYAIPKQQNSISRFTFYNPFEKKKTVEQIKASQQSKQQQYLSTSMISIIDKQLKYSQSKQKTEASIIQVQPHKLVNIKNQYLKQIKRIQDKNKKQNNQRSLQFIEPQNSSSMLMIMPVNMKKSIKARLEPNYLVFRNTIHASK